MEQIQLNFAVLKIEIMKKQHPKSFFHIGLTVLNIKEVVKFYSEVIIWT